MNDVGSNDKSSGDVRPVGIPDDIAMTAEQTPVQPHNISFPVTYFSSKGRSFNPAWFTSYTYVAGVICEK